MHKTLINHCEVYLPALSAAPLLNFHLAVLTSTKDTNINTGQARGMSNYTVIPRNWALAPN